MKTFSVIISGFGGQGILMAGQLLAYAGIIEGKHVAWVPSYGVEMRGGTANCSVVISDGEVSSPLVEKPDALLVFNRPSLDKFEPLLEEGGLLLYNSSMVSREDRPANFRVFGIPANELADELGNNRVANMIMLGALLELENVVSLDSIMEALKKVLPPHRHDLLPLNEEALRQGAESLKAGCY
jgi:2-oxoglutarate ferredoxin oxidoreductase subunit gamma